MNGLLKKLLSRGVVVAAGCMALVVGVPAFAYAGDTVEYVSFNGVNRGKMKHIDDGDRFQVCDVHSDGTGVKGYLEKRAFPGAPWIIIDSEDDGGDAGCDYFHKNILEVYPPWDNYRLQICWRNYCDTDKFHE